MLPLASTESSSHATDARLPGPAIVPMAMKDYDSTSVAPRHQPPGAQHQSLAPASQVPMTDDDAESVKKAVEYLMWEIRAWRGLNSAQWVLWGLVQAKIPGLIDSDDVITPTIAEQDPGATPTEQSLENSGQSTESNPKSDGGDQIEEEEEDGFDYLAYAKQRASFFWGDIISLGIMQKDELPEEVVKEAEILDY
jgi:choline kinase